MTEKSNGVVILITLLNILLYKLQKLQEAQQKTLLPLSVRQLCRRFSLWDIKSATENFKEELVIGKGGFGIVYKGVIDSPERTVAIKRSQSMSKQGNKEFLTEIEMLSQFQHSHLVSLIGYCNDCEEMILVYDYMPSGSLADHLHRRVRKGNTSLPSLSWVQRLKICIGAAHGLDYLHTGTSVETRVIHRDVKTTNILLDENLAAKISDFGLSKTGPANQTCTYVSTRVKGTHGYLDPYYVATHRLTRKSDVYAFGVVLFEVLCGRPAVDPSLDEEKISLAGWAQHCSKEGILEQISDPNIKANISSDSLKTYVDVAIKCLHTQPKLRPTMAEVVVGLESALTLQEKSTYYSLAEIIPSDYSQEDVDSSLLQVKNTIHNEEDKHIGEEIENVSTNWHRSKEYSGRMAFTKRFSSILSVTVRAFWGNKDTKTSRYSKGVLSVNSNKSQAANHQKILTEVLQSSNMKIFKFNDLKNATGNFRPDCMLGVGGFGCVFKGWVNEKTFAATKRGTGLVIAVRRLNHDGSQGHQERLSEISYLGTLTHPNLVKLIGYCLEEKDRLLVYEFMPNGSLDTYLFRSTALGAAKGLAYLHRSRKLVIYRDLKASNILIDSDYDAKLSDFGMAKDGADLGRSHVTTRVMGTYGYAAPEYMATGRGAIDLSVPSPERNLIDWGMPYLTSKCKILHVMDARIKGQYTVREALKVSSLAHKCLSAEHKLRPGADEVVEALDQIADLRNS